MEDGVQMVRRIANLASLGISEKEEIEFAQDLNLIIGYMEQLSRIDTKDAEPMEHVLSLKNVLRPDVPVNKNRREELMKCAPSIDNGCYIVPSVVESV